MDKKYSRRIGEVIEKYIGQTYVLQKHNLEGLEDLYKNLQKIINLCKSFDLLASCKNEISKVVYNKLPIGMKKKLVNICEGFHPNLDKIKEILRKEIKLAKEKSSISSGKRNYDKAFDKKRL